MDMSDMTTIARIATEPGFILVATFSGEETPRRADLTGLIARSRWFRPLADQPEAFAKVKIINRGGGLEWPVETEFGNLDLSADTVLRIAQEQEPMTGEDFATWRADLGCPMRSQRRPWASAGGPSSTTRSGISCRP